MARSTGCDPEIPKPDKSLPVAPKDRKKASALFARLVGKQKKIVGKAQRAVDLYKGMSYIEINRELRKPGYLAKRVADLLKKVGPDAPVWRTGQVITPEVAADLIKELDKVTSLQTTEPMVVFRGLSSPRIKKAKPGAVFTDAAYQSTSISSEVAELFAERAKVNGVVLEIEAPAGTRGAFIYGTERPEFSIEREFLLPRGTTFQVIANDGKGRVRVRIVPVG